MRRKVLAITLASAFALSSGTAFADPPQAGNSGKFKGSSNPCQGGNQPQCPPHGGG
jgi:hypothetical protein